METKKFEKTYEEQKEDFKKMVTLAHTENCPKCYGRGYIGYNLKLKMFTPCVCLQKAERKITQERLAQRKVNEN